MIANSSCDSKIKWYHRTELMTESKLVTGTPTQRNKVAVFGLVKIILKCFLPMNGIHDLIMNQSSRDWNSETNYVYLPFLNL